MRYIYLHGFASSPGSAKAVYLGDRFAELGVSLLVPDLNQGDFSHLTITRQIQQIQAEFLSTPTPITLIGSSLGGLTAAWLGEYHPVIQRLILLAPAFGFLSHWLSTLGKETLHRWQVEGYRPIYHYGEQKELPLSYQFVADARQYEPTHRLKRPIPTLILHGQHDEVIPINESLIYAKERSWVQLIPLNSDHSLSEVKAEILQSILTFCQ